MADSINDVNWYKIHALAIKHSRSIPCILLELDRTIDNLLDDMAGENLSAGEIKQLREHASLIGRTCNYLRQYGQAALDQAEDMYILDQAKSDV